MNFILMPRYGAIGATIATLLAEIIQMTMQMIFSRNVVNNFINILSVWKIIFATLVCTFITGILKVIFININPLIRICLIAMICGILYIFLIIFVLREKEARNLWENSIKNKEIYSMIK